MHKVRYKTPDEVERKKLSGTSAIFDVVTKDGQKVHVADQMNNVPVEEHGRHNSPGSPALQEDGRDEPQFADEPVGRKHLHYENHDVQGDEGIGRTRLASDG